MNIFPNHFNNFHFWFEFDLDFLFLDSLILISKVTQGQEQLWPISPRIQSKSNLLPILEFLKFHLPRWVRVALACKFIKRKSCRPMFPYQDDLFYRFILRMNLNLTQIELISSDCNLLITKLNFAVSKISSYRYRPKSPVRWYHADSQIDAFNLCGDWTVRPSLFISSWWVSARRSSKSILQCSPDTDGQARVHSTKQKTKVQGWTRMK